MDDKLYDLLVKLYDEFNRRFDKVDGKLANIDGRLENVEGRLENVEDRLGNVEDRLSKLEIKIDGEITDKIRALFDDREVIHEKIDNIQVDIKNLSMKTDNYDNMIVELYSRIK